MGQGILTLKASHELIARVTQHLERAVCPRVRIVKKLQMPKLSYLNREFLSGFGTTDEEQTLLSVGRQRVEKDEFGTQSKRLSQLNSLAGGKELWQSENPLRNQKNTKE
jgi:hypothetical protein